MCVGLFGHSAVVFHVFYVLLTVCVVVFFQCIAASLFNKLTYLLTSSCNDDCLGSVFIDLVLAVVDERASDSDSNSSTTSIDDTAADSIGCSSKLLHVNLDSLAARREDLGVFFP